MSEDPGLIENEAPADLDGPGDMVIVEHETPRHLDVPGGNFGVSTQWSDRKERRHFTYWLLGLTVVLTFSVIAAAVWGPERSWPRISSQVGFLLTPFHTLLGIAIGYYFADKRRQP